jgi:hypothetical protein
MGPMLYMSLEIRDPSPQRAFLHQSQAIGHQSYDASGKAKKLIGNKEQFNRSETKLNENRPVR